MYIPTLTLKERRALADSHARAAAFAPHALAALLRGKARRREKARKASQRPGRSIDPLDYALVKAPKKWGQP